MFYDEIDNYYKNNKKFILSKMRHFTQVVWRNTTKIGCAVVFNSYYDKIIIVCRYSPPGNWNNR